MWPQGCFVGTCRSAEDAGMALKKKQEKKTKEEQHGFVFFSVFFLSDCLFLKVDGEMISSALILSFSDKLTVSE